MGLANGNQMPKCIKSLYRAEVEVINYDQVNHKWGLILELSAISTTFLKCEFELPLKDH